MKVVILCGGKGTRMREETEFIPKPMVQIGGKPVIWHIMKMYAHYGYCDFVLCLGYKGDVIRDYFLNYRAHNSDFTIRMGKTDSIEFYDDNEDPEFNITIVDTGIDTMTGGRIKRVSKYLEGKPFMVTYGDGLSDVNIKELVKFHEAHNKLATLTAVKVKSRFGIVEAEKSGQIKQFTEKPQGDDLINAGFFVFEPGVLNYIENDETILEEKPLRSLARDNEIMANVHDRFFYPMDTYREYLILNKMWDRNEAPWKLW